MSKKLCKDTEIRAFSHWYFEFSMARFWAVPVFCNKVWTIWSAYATADYPARPGRPHGQTYQHKSPLESWQWRNISLFTFLAGWTNEQVLDKGIRQKPQKEWARSLFAMPFIRGLPSVTRWTPRKWHVCQSWNNAAKCVCTSSVLQLGKVLRVYTSTEAKW